MGNNPTIDEAHKLFCEMMLLFFNEDGTTKAVSKDEMDKFINQSEKPNAK